MTLDLVFVPLLGGYIFFSRFRGTRYRASGFPAQRILFPSAAFGLCFLVAAQATLLAVAWFESNPAAGIRHAVGFALPAASLCVIASILWGAWGSLIAEAAPGPESEVPEVTSGDSRIAVPAMFESIESRALIQGVVGVIGCVWIVMATAAASDLDVKSWARNVFSYFAVMILVATLAAHSLARFTLWRSSAMLFRICAVQLLVAAAMAAVAAYPGAASKAWIDFSPVQDSGVPALALLYAIAAWACGNLVLHPLAAAAFHFTTDRMTHLQSLFFESLFGNALIQLNLDDNKVYIGWVRSRPAEVEAADQFILFLPLKSGFREKDSRALVLDTDYGHVLTQLKDETGSAEELNDRLESYYKVIRIETIRYAGVFDENDYVRFSLGAKGATVAGEGTVLSSASA